MTDLLAQLDEDERARLKQAEQPAWQSPMLPRSASPSGPPTALRHPRFLGLRRDKAASEVTRERAEA